MTVDSSAHSLEVTSSAHSLEVTTLDTERSSLIEWLEVNGNGGYASGTVATNNTRRYHALLLVAQHPPHDRVVLVNQLAERLETSAGKAELSSYPLDLDAPAPRASTVAFSARPVPRWEYDALGVRIVRTVVCPRGRNIVIVRWLLLGAPGATARLQVRPMLTGRVDHDVTSADDAIATGASVESGRVRWKPRADMPAIVAFGPSPYRHAPSWRRGIEYPIDHERGEAWREDWWSPGEFTIELKAGVPTSLAFGTEEDDALEVERLVTDELARRSASATALPPSGNRLFDELRISAESYFVEFGKDKAAVMAGFPWFDAWTRDTFTAFSGLFLATGRFDEARRVLCTFAPLVEGGLLPNSLPDPKAKTRWNAADASLWFVISAERYLACTDDVATLERVWPAVRAVLEGYRTGTANGDIAVADDGLLRASSDKALTWMDAEYKKQVMTPRRGKPVEIQALWVSALEAGRAMAERVGDGAFATLCVDMRARARTTFHERFWYEKGGYLYDVVDGPGGDDATLRPNQVFALSLASDLVTPERAVRILEVIRERLLTPRGLRTLSDDASDYHAHYTGSRAERDPAYHQGTVWPFLLGPFASAWVRVHSDTQDARDEALGFFRGLEEYLLAGACPGHLCEIFDADAPHAPRGCFAQAWSAGELLFSLWRDILMNRRHLLT